MKNSSSPQNEYPSSNTQPKWMYYIMIAWIALTFLFLTFGLIGLVVQWTGGSVEPYSKVQSSTLVLVALGAILLIEVLNGFMSRPDEDEAVSAKPKLTMKSVITYCVIVAVILVVGTTLRSTLPVLTIPPWLSLVLFVVGIVLLKPLFLRKSTRVDA
ncbi:hypothetical protein Q5741_14170 [Paenibacillus sp. JX-17]|uniref:DUF2178 domain-containing protein n=1 Tax=Paenibacillus lacisoli TaxID=3064525 RepID=A0ABT9CE69_9BACL|nr:hypothetical protein [Paenibacillus sp. JX-17]MDO7907551.1 hypothetical protein [Paenibacillus sp. JX-17]